MNSDEFQQIHYITNNEQQNQPQQKMISNEKIVFEDPKYQNVQIRILNLTTQTFMTIQTQYYHIEVIDGLSNRYQIKRRYSDFQLLYNALTMNFIGCILPYFPTKSIESFFIGKLNMYGQKSKNDSLKLRKAQLEKFLQILCNHPNFRYSQEIKIFISKSEAEFKKGKKILSDIIAETQISQNKTGGVLSLFQRGVAWISTSNTEQYKLEQIPQWQNTQSNINNLSIQVALTVQNFTKLVHLKKQEVMWSGPDTQVDTVQKLKAKIISGRQFNSILIEQLQDKVIYNLNEQLKILKQIEKQLQYRTSITQLIIYLRKYHDTTSQKVKKLLRKKQEFQKSMIAQWKQYEKVHRKQLKTIAQNFNAIWKNYSQKMQKIWK